MSVQHNNVPRLAFLEICFKRGISEDSMKIWFTWSVDQEAYFF